jgi:hypothetical protein
MSITLKRLCDISMDLAAAAMLGYSVPVVFERTDRWMPFGIMFPPLVVE